MFGYFDCDENKLQSCSKNLNLRDTEKKCIFKKNNNNIRNKNE